MNIGSLYTKYMLIYYIQTNNIVLLVQKILIQNIHNNILA